MSRASAAARAALLLALALGVAGCGVKGPIAPPGPASAAAQQDVEDSVGY